MLHVRELPKNLEQPDLLLPNGYIRLLPSQAYDAIPFQNLRLWCHFNGRYGLATAELVEWLQGFIYGSETIEIGAGAGDLSHHLGIRPTDNRCQEWPDVRIQYAITGQPTITYPPTVEAIDALDAVRKYQPRIVIASWVTEWVDPNGPIPEKGGCMYGIKENELLDTGVTYVLIGSEPIHGRKSIMARPHKTFVPRWLRSRTQDNALNRIWIWEGK